MSDDYDDLDQRFYRMQQRMDNWEEKMQAGFDDIHRSLIMMSGDEFIGETFDEYEKYFTFEKTRSFKFRKCIVSGHKIYPGNVVYKGTLEHEGRVRVIWVSTQEMLFRVLKKDFNK